MRRTMSSSRPRRKVRGKICIVDPLINARVRVIQQQQQAGRKTLPLASRSLLVRLPLPLVQR